jgi:hypothetical protein
MDEIKLKTNINPNYKTKKCIQFYENGYCPYGIRCQFLHKENEMGVVPCTSSNNSIFSSPQTILGGVSQISKEISYRKIMESLMENLAKNNETDTQINLSTLANPNLINNKLNNQMIKLNDGSINFSTLDLQK